MYIRQKLFTSYIAVTVIPVLLLSFLIFVNVKESLKKEEFSKLEVIADLKVKTIQSIFHELEQDIISGQNFYNIKLNFPVLTLFQNDRNDPTFIDAANILYDQLRVMAKNKGLLDIRFVDLEGKTVYTIDKKHFEAEQGKTVPYFSKELLPEWQKGIWVSDIFKHENYFTMLMTAPAYDLKQKVIGFIVFEVDMESIYGIIQDTTGLGQTGETLIGKRIGNEAIFLNRLRHDKDAALKRKIAVGDSIGLPMLEAAWGKSGIGVSTDYRGKKVVAVWRYIPSLDWGLVSKIDFQEAFAPIERLQNLIFLFIITTLILIAAFSFLTAKSISDPIRRLHRGMEVIGNGNLDYKVAINTKDEIGWLSRTFDQMAGRLKITTTSVDKLNKEIVHRRNAEEKALRAAEEWGATFDSIADGISIHDPEFNIINANESLCRMLGKKKEEIIGKKCYQVFHDKRAPIPECPLMRTKASKQRDHGEFFEASLQKWLSVSVSPVMDDKGGIQKIVHVVRDITERKRMEGVKDEFVGIVSHELRTPLSIIREGTAQVFEGMHGTITERQAHFLSMAINSIERITRIVNRLLDLSKMEAGKTRLNKEKTDLVELIKNIKEDFTIHIAEKGIEVRQNLPEGRVEAYFDKDKITEVFVNLLSNAMKFTQKGYVEISVADKADHVECGVADTGRGISEENLPKMFNKFEQFGRMEGPGEQGVGLGLAICRGIIEMHNGRIWAQSRINEGTRIIFTLPKN